MAYSYIYCRKEPARDGTPNKFDVVLYRDVGNRPSSISCGRREWYKSDKPDGRHKFVVFNNIRYRIKWLDHMGNSNR